MECSSKRETPKSRCNKNLRPSFSLSAFLAKIHTISRQKLCNSRAHRYGKCGPKTFSENPGTGGGRITITKLTTDSKVSGNERSCRKLRSSNNASTLQPSTLQVICHKRALRGSLSKEVNFNESLIIFHKLASTLFAIF